ncbi:UvrY/SirA/GacA family response regulator transcription factor [Inmirania thermothiophila]|uniref:LuxR family two component transcriptional regulator n=1 Tax=Inmirania thermothiophila TaxID=1750597 RepID=A0A3N1Y011_9GAMM|nr:UvrY/SirA/GacA family response regulator transcription factor [Inmirania thermothiophila]ROR32183.1 LuxR family two component transcriptional regulator [Inmirania thermothiophila]
MIKVMLVDDHALVRTGIRRIVESAPDMEVVAEAGSGEEAVEIARRDPPDVVLMDIHMPGVGGLEATRKLLHYVRGIRILVLTVHGGNSFPVQFLRAGAMGFLTKGCEAEEMLRAIRQVHRGERYVSADIAQQLAIAAVTGEQTSPFEKLSAREMQVLLMVAQGQSIREISDRLCLSPKTVSTYRYRLHEKLGVDNDVELTRLAIQHGVIDQSAGV